MHIQATRDVFFVILGPLSSPDHTIDMQMRWRLKKGHQNTGAGRDPKGKESHQPITTVCADSSENISCIFRK
jgi:hypothetical protein